MRYAHTQNAPLHWLLHGVTAVLCIGAWWSRGEPMIATVLVLSAVSSSLISLAFVNLTVRDQGEHMDVRYGPLPLFRTTIRYQDVHSARAARSNLVDGWGVHYIPGRGWTFNLWGRDCVEFQHKSGTTRIGTDDVEGVLDCLRAKDVNVTS